MTSITQIETANANQHADPLPCADIFWQMEELCRSRRRDILLANNWRHQLDAFDKHGLGEPTDEHRMRFLNEMTAAEMRRVRVEMEIVRVARSLVKEIEMD